MLSALVTLPDVSGTHSRTSLSSSASVTLHCPSCPLPAQPLEDIEAGDAVMDLRRL